MLKAQETPSRSLPKPQTRRLVAPPLPDNSQMKCPPGTHGEVHPQISGCFPDCLKGWHPRTASEPDACIKGRDSCAVISPAIGFAWKPNTFNWEASLCDATPVVRTQVNAIYPSDSAQNHEEGTAEFLIIGHPDGKVQVLTGVHWAPLRLQRAGEAALRHWRWRQYRVEGHPIEFRTTVYFKFEVSPDGPQVQTFLRKPPKNSR